MTSYQNVQESQIKGYNDCPILDYSSKNSSSTSLKSRRRLVSQLNNTITTNLDGSIPKPPTSLKPPSFKTHESNETGETTTDQPTTESISDEELLKLVEKIIKLPNSLPEREFNHYSKRILDNFQKGINNEQYKLIIYKNLQNYSNKEQVKNELIKFILSNDGVSTWCLPLRKVLENIKI
ncbi:hypothetical protein BN7_4671 [Wickerhamomyces ciferrii]|uniref:Uncharacterized protein n=1 Tax=Wickerhamomyces ciferrii (strain ATCC 14091 / BCRC 22168 / CBS 111 / JCM 3599 / NBRC 0793 / NRRL Y-1031 F-60-10) TaxID=1206466 RepID=K0KVA8_WICCF|nr:uncharacterized protein BN7_4671 [Wickerhamomyces ciferrii]CCH45093.1 hypothetical protein BN7_4671 [Wickerhamomyces ciferrii]